jgi:hypothetical protein
MAESPRINESTSTATAVAEPPTPPGAPPATSAGASPAPKRRRWIAWVVGIVSVVIVIGALVGVVIWATGRGAKATDFSAYRPGFESAMKKAGTAASFPAAPVELGTVSATGSHPFEATFTADEITSLVNVFPWTTSIQGTAVAVSGVSVGFPAAGTGSLSARVKINDSSYGGSLEGPVAYEAGRITSTGATKVVAEGFPVSGDRAGQATEMLLVYLNAYLSAAPGLGVDSAEVTDSGVVVKGTAPDALTLP